MSKSILGKLHKSLLSEAVNREKNIIYEIERLGITTEEAIANYHLEVCTRGSSRLVINNPMEKKE